MHTLVVESTPQKIRKVKWKLRRLGLKKISKEKFVGLTSRTRKVEKVRKFCKTYSLRFKIENSYGDRSSTYRKNFFDYYEPNASRGRWYCAYCGKKLKKEKVEVDHLYPIEKVSRSLKLQKKLRNKGICSVNDPLNLVAACQRCNSKKRFNMQFWILRGTLGRESLFWKVKKFLLLFITFILLMELLKNGIFNNVISVLKHLLNSYFH